MAIRYHYDLYPRTDPRDGTRIRRFTKLQRAMYRDVIGVGSGAADIRSTDAEADDLDPLGEQYVRIVREDTTAETELVVAGFWINRFNHDTAVARETKRLTFSGAGHLAYLARARMWSHTYMGAAGAGAGITTGAQDPFDDIWRLWNQGDWAGGDYLGAVFHRVIMEALSYQSGAYTHRHKDGEFYTDTHADDRTGGSAISLITLGFDKDDDSDGNPWSVPSGEFQASVGENVLSVTQRLMQAGLYVELDPDTFELRAWENDEHRRDRTGGAWGANVVRFQAPTDGTVDTGNMLNDSEREINSHLKRTIMLAGGQDSYAKATASGDIRWEGFEPSTAAEGAALTQLASTQITARSEAADAGSVRMKLGTTPLSGRYRPWEEVRLDDLVTVHTGTGEWDYDEATYPVAGLKIELQKSGAWWAWAELGASFSPGADRRFQVHPPTAHTHPPNPELCRIGNPGTSSSTRLYFSEAAGDVTPITVDAGWEASTGTGSVDSLTTSPDNTFTASASATTSGGGDVAGRDVHIRSFLYGPLSSAEAAVIAAGGSGWRTQVRGRMRYGVGIDEGDQAGVIQQCVRVTAGATSTIRGTALALHSVTEDGSNNLPAQATKYNREATGTLSAVGACVAGDYLLVEMGIRNYTISSETSGGAIAFTGMDSLGDLPEGNDNSGSSLNSWIEWSVTGSGATPGELPFDTVRQGEEATGTSVRASRCDHQHAHGFLAPDGSDYHGLSQLSNYVFHSGIDPTASDDGDDGFVAGTHWINDTDGTVFILIDPESGAAVWVPLGAATIVLSDDTPLVESGSGDEGTSDEASRSDHVHPAGSAAGLDPPWVLMPYTGATIINSSNSVGANNRALIFPADLYAAATITGVRFRVNASAGNISVGLYDASLNRLATSGSVACPASGQANVAFSSSYAAIPGRYYIGLSASSTGATFYIVQQTTTGGVIAPKFMDTAHPLPDPFVSAGTTSIVPAVFGVISGGWAP
jgi:hypothetical protein